MRYTVDAALCSGHGQCFVTAPDVFGPDDEGLNRDIGKTVEADDRHLPAAQAAARNCPDQAIRVMTTGHVS